MFLAVQILASSIALAANNPAPDPTIPGPFAVTYTEYDFGPTALSLPEFPRPVEVTASVHHPTDLTAGPFPLVLLIHGMHATCFEGTYRSSTEWPCISPSAAIPSYRGYDYIGSVLASHGYIVVSISANAVTVDSDQTPDLGMLARAQLIQHHLEIWRTFATDAGSQFGNQFVGAVDLQNIGLMGHSRGGEGVARFVQLNREQGSPYAIKAALLLSPTNFNRFVVNDVPLAVVVPYCDSEVEELPGVHYLDDARYNVPGDRASKHTIVLGGANHNFFNTYWTSDFFSPGSWDDGVCGGMPNRLTSAQQRGAGLAYTTGFFRLFLSGESQFAAMFRGDDAPPASAMTDDILISHHAPDTPQERLDLSRTLDSSSLIVDALGQPVMAVGLASYRVCGGDTPAPEHCLPDHRIEQQPHTAPALRSTRRGLSQISVAWDLPTGFLQFTLPVGPRDITGYFALQLRAAVNFADSRNTAGMTQDFSVTLTDGAGRQSTTTVGRWSNALAYPAGSGLLLPRVILNAIRIPLFAFSAVDLTDIRTVRFQFDQRPSGGLLISDIAFTGSMIRQTRISAPPSIVLTSPDPEKVYAAGSTLTLAASASDPDGQVVRVVFYQGSSLLGEVGAEPFGLLWPSAAAGTHTITAVAWDDSGNFGTSVPITVKVKSLPRIMPLGDSITDGQGVPGGYRVELWRLLTDAGITVDFVGSLMNGPVSLPDRDHQGISGTKIAQLTSNIDTWLPAYRPDVVLLMVGAGDMWHNDNITNAPARLSALIDRIFMQQPGAAVVVATTPRWNDSVVNPRIVAYNAAIPDVVAAHQALGRRVTFVDMYATVALTDLYDGIHPSAEGHRKMAAVWYSAVRPLLGSGLNIPPHVVLTSPAPATTFVEPAVITLSATADDAHGVGEVEFLANGNSLGGSTGPPFQVTWQGVKAGDYVLVARARDSTGVVGVSAPISIAVTAPSLSPAVRLTTPAAGALFAAPATITLTAEATDADGIARVEFYAGTSRLGEATTAPYGLTWSGVAAGTYQVTARAWDTDNVSSTSEPLTIAVSAVSAGNQPPTVRLTTPAAATRFDTLATVTLTAEATDPDGTIARVEFYADATLIGQATAPPYEVTWGPVNAGTYDLTARARDAAGASSTSAVVAIRVGPLRIMPLGDSITDGHAVPGGYRTELWRQIGSGGRQIDFVGSQISGPLSLPDSEHEGHRGWTIDDLRGSLTGWLTTFGPDVVLLMAGANDVIENANVATAPARMGLLIDQIFAQRPGATVIVGTTLRMSDPVEDAEVLAYNAALPEVVAARQTLGRSIVLADLAAAVPLTDLYDGIHPTAEGHRKLAVAWYIALMRELTNNTPPSVSLTQPAAGTQISLPASVTLRASATDPDGIVSTIEFFSNAVSLGLAAPPNVQLPWSPATAGTYELTVKARDAAGGVALSAPVSVIVAAANKPPTVQLTAPSASSSFDAPATIVLTADAADTDGVISRVEFYRDSLLLGQTTAPPYKITWNAVPAGTHRISVAAYDDDGARTDAGPVIVEVRLPQVSIQASDASAAENSSNPGEFILSRSGNFQSNLTVTYLVGGTASTGADYTALSGVASIPSGTASTRIVITALADVLSEGDETVVLTVLPGALYTLGVQTVATVVIVDRATVTVQSSVGAVREGTTTNAAFTLTRTGNTTQSLSISLLTGGSATVGTDYKAFGSLVTIPAGAASIDVPLVVLDDAVAEKSEVVSLRVSPVSTYMVGAPEQAAITIEDDEPLISITASDPSATEPGSDSATLTISRDRAGNKAVTVYFTVAGTASHGGDYKYIGTSATIVPGATAVSLTILPINDFVVEKPETVVTTLVAHSSYTIMPPVAATATIEDDEPFVSITAADIAASEAGLDTAAFVITRTGSVAAPLTVYWSRSGTAANGADYHLIGSQATIPIGTDRITVLITPVNDFTAEKAETVTLTLYSPTSYTVADAAATITIADDEPTVTVSAPDSVAAEPGANTGLLTINLSSPGPAPLIVYFRVSGTASHGVDFRSLGTSVTIPAGSTSMPIVVAPLNDVAAEPPETIVFELTPNLAYTVGATSVVTMMLEDDEPVVSVSALDPEASETGMNTGTFLVSRTGTVGVSLTVSVALAGTAINSRDYAFIGATVTIPAGKDSAIVAVTPIADAVGEIQETVTMTITAQPRYLLGTTHSATVTIQDGT